MFVVSVPLMSPDESPTTNSVLTSMLARDFDIELHHLHQSNFYFPYRDREMNRSPVPQSVHLYSSSDVSEEDDSISTVSQINSSTTRDNDPPSLGTNSIYEDFDVFSLHSFATNHIVSNRIEQPSKKVHARALKQIQALQVKLCIQEDSEVALLNQCLDLQKRIVERESLPIQSHYMKIMEQENKILKYTQRNTELKHAIDFDEVDKQVKKIENDSAIRDVRIGMLEAEVSRRKRYSQ